MAQDIRNVAVVGPGKAGKTTLVEAILFRTGASDRLGKVEDGTTVTDYEPEEVSRQISLGSSLAFCDYEGARLNIIDTPGFVNFLEDTRGAMRAADGAIVVVSAISGVKGETEKVWGYAEEFKVPRIIYVNKLDKEAADFAACLDTIRKQLNTEPVVVHLPIGSGENFKGMVDLLTQKAFTCADGKASEFPVPDEVKGDIEKYRKLLIEKVAESDDALIEKYLEGQDPTDEQIRVALRSGTIARKITPVTIGAPHKGIGVEKLLDVILACMPAPSDMSEAAPMAAKDPASGADVVRKADPNGPLAAYVFKTIADPFAGKLSMFRVVSGTLKPDATVYNPRTDTKERVGQVFYLLGKKHVPATAVPAGDIAVVAKLKATNTGDTLCDESAKTQFVSVKFAEPLISYAVAPKTKGDEDKVSIGLHKILDEDPTLHFHRDEEGKEMILSGMGQLHLEVTLEKLKRKFGVEVEMHAPKIPYRETIRAATKAQGRYKKQSGGKGQFGDCWIEVEPLPRGTGYEFVDNVVGGAIPRQYIPAVDKGIQEALHQGIYAGYQMVDVRVKLFDGSYHAVDSSEMAFKIAGSMAIKKAVESAKPVVLEPVMNVLITIPDEYLGTVIGDLNGRRGKVQGMDQVPGTANQRVSASVPMAEMLTYANQLQSMTAGRGVYHMEFSHYEDLPGNLSQKLLDEKAKKEAEKH